MPAKKLITAQIDLNGVRTLDGDITQFLAKTPSEDQIHSFFQKRYQPTQGTLHLGVDKNVVSFKWTLAEISEPAEKLHKEALGLARKKEYAKAIELWVKAIAENPVDPDYYFNAGIAFFELKNFKEAIENLEYTISLCPIHAKARLILGTVYLKIRKFDQAEIHLKESIYFNQDNALALLNLAAALSILKKYDEGMRVFKRVIELSPAERPRAYFGLGKIHSICGRVKDANECFRKVIELDKQGTLANHAKRAIISDPTTSVFSVKTNSTSDIKIPKIDPEKLDDAYAEAYNAFLYGDYKKAIGFYKRYLEIKPKDDYVWYSLGEALLRDSKPKEAAYAFTKAIKLKSTKGLYFKQLAIAYDYLEDADRAIDAAERAIALGKSDSVLLTIYGKNLLRKERVAEAIDKLEQAYNKNKMNLTAQYFLAQAYIKNEDYDSASEHLHWIMATKIKTPIKMQAEALLDKIQG